MLLCRFLLKLLIIFSSFTVSLAQGRVEIDASKGATGGRVAIGLWPGIEDESGEIRAIEPGGFEGRLVPQDSLDEEWGYPCGTWFQPPPNKYKFWLEGNGMISPFSSVMIYGGGRFQGQGLASITAVVPAGIVRIPADAELPAHVTLRLLHLDSHSKGAFLKREMSRRVSVELAHTGVFMPEGRIIAVLFDNMLQEYVAISTPVEISSGATTFVWPKSPQEGSDLLVALTRPSDIPRKSDHDVRLFITGIEGGPREPDIVVSTRDRIYGFWYGLHGGAYATLEVKSETVFLSPQDLVLRKRKVENFSGILRPLPKVEVEISLPNEMTPRDMALEILAAAEMRSIRRVDLSPGTEAYNFETLPTEAIYIKLETPPWAYYEWLDLSEGGDHKAHFQPSPIHVTGTVYRGTVEHPASLTFRTNRMNHEDELTVETDEQGHYGVILFRSGEYVVFVRLKGGMRPAFIDYPQIDEKFSVVVDFHVPPNRYWVNVINSETGDGIAGAEVYADSTFAEGQRGESSLYTTDDEGLVELPPLRRGEVAISAKAKGYLPSEWTRELIKESAPERELTIVLRPIGSTAPLRLLLSDGAPAVNAEVRAQAALDNTLPFWEGRCDQAGFVNIPDYADDAYILVRHPDAGSTIRRWRRSEASGEYLEWSLAPPAPPLSVNVSRAWGDPVGASLALWLYDLRVTGRTLAWLTGSPVGGTNIQGEWQAHNLPPTSISILAWTHSVTGGALAGVYDLFAVSIPFPWPDIVKIETAD